MKECIAIFLIEVLTGFIYMEKVSLKIYRDGYVYCLEDLTDGICRIGRTDKGAGDRRILSQVAYYPFELGITKKYVNNIYGPETFIHNYFNNKRFKADWFKITPKDFKSALCKYNKIIGKSEDKFIVENDVYKDVVYQLYNNKKFKKIK